jgi:hypothetical protein
MDRQGHSSSHRWEILNSTWIQGGGVVAILPRVSPAAVLPKVTCQDLVVLQPRIAHNTPRSAKGLLHAN